MPLYNLARDYYLALGFLVDAVTPEQIKTAYRRAIFEVHPDRATPKADGERAKLLTEAYKTLSDPAKRKVYDAERSRYYAALWAKMKANAAAKAARDDEQRRASVIEGLVGLGVALVGLSLFSDE